MNQTFFNWAVQMPVTLCACIYFIASGNTRTRTIPLQDKPVNVMDGLQCYEDGLRLNPIESHSGLGAPTLAFEIPAFPCRISPWRGEERNGPCRGPPADQYLEERLEQYRTWYGRKPVSRKSRYLVMRSATLIAAGSMPALADLPDFPLVRPFITIASLLMVFLLSLENLFQYQEQWT